MIERNLEFPPLGRSVGRRGEGEILFVEFFRNVLPAFQVPDAEEGAFFKNPHEFPLFS